MSWLPLTIFSAFCIATADALTRKYLQGYRARELVMVRFAMPGLILLPVLLMQPMPDLQPEFWYWVAAAVPLEVVAMLLYVQAIRDTSLTLTLPYLSFTPVFNTLTGYLLLGETVSMSGFLGIMIVVIGAWLLNIEHARGERFDVVAPFRAIVRERGSRLMLMTAAIFSLTSVLGKGALAYTTPMFFGPFYFAAIALVVVVVFSAGAGTPVRVLWRRPLPHLAVGIFMSLMVLSHFAAIQYVEVAYMVAVKRSSLLFGMIYSVLLFKERARIEQFVAGGLMVAGVYLIAS
ncbi:MAG: DMT family transporter [Pseudomonadota bacterium]